MPKLSGLNAREKALAERIGNAKITKGKPISDRLALGVGFVIARRTQPTIGLQAYLDGHTADEVRDTLEDLPKPKPSGDGGGK